MALYSITTSTDLTVNKPKRVASVNLRNSGTACTVNIRDGSASGTILIPVFLDVGSTTIQTFGRSFSQPFPNFPNGVYVEVSGGTLVGSVDLV